eukprot:NODE_308_length_10101_cov_0.990102.p1 type:complete len:990 gc:universal NODE_308_length_10101_cov_0.990102:6847-9816(+)
MEQRRLGIVSQQIELKAEETLEWNVKVNFKHHGPISEEICFFENQLQTQYSINISGAAVVLNVELSSQIISFPLLDANKEAQISVWIRNNSDYVMQYHLEEYQSDKADFISELESNTHSRQLGSYYRPWDTRYIGKPVSKQLFLSQSDAIVYPHSFARIEAVFAPKRCGLFRSNYFLRCTGCEFPFLIEMNAESEGPRPELNIENSFAFIVGQENMLPLVVKNLSEKHGLTFEVTATSNYFLKVTNRLNGYLNPSDVSNSKFYISSDKVGKAEILVLLKIEELDMTLKKVVAIHFKLPAFSISIPDKIQNTFLEPIQIPIYYNSKNIQFCAELLPHKSKIYLNSLKGQDTLTIESVEDLGVTLLANSKWGVLDKKFITIEKLLSKSEFVKTLEYDSTSITKERYLNIDIIACNNYLNEEKLTIRMVEGPVEVDIKSEVFYFSSSIQIPVIIKPISGGNYIVEIQNSSGDIMSIKGDFYFPKVDIICKHDDLTTLTMSLFEFYGDCDEILDCKAEIYVDNFLVYKSSLQTKELMKFSFVFKECRPHLFRISYLWRNEVIGEYNGVIPVYDEPIQIIGSLDFQRVPISCNPSKLMYFKNHGETSREIILKCNNVRVNFEKKRFNLEPDQSIEVAVSIQDIGKIEENAVVFIKNRVFAKIPIKAIVSNPKIKILSDLSLPVQANCLNYYNLCFQNIFDEELLIQIECQKALEGPKWLKIKPSEKLASTLTFKGSEYAADAIQLLKISISFKNCKIKQFVTVLNSNFPSIPLLVSQNNLASGLKQLTFNSGSILRSINNSFPRSFKETTFTDSQSVFTVIDPQGFKTRFSLKQRPYFEISSVKQIVKTIRCPNLCFDLSLPLRLDEASILCYKNENTNFKYLNSNQLKSNILVSILNPKKILKGFFQYILNGYLGSIPYKFTIEPLILTINSTRIEYFDVEDVEIECNSKVVNSSNFPLKFEYQGAFVDEILEAKASFVIGNKNFQIKQESVK